jgi:hypothetical protein
MAIHPNIIQLLRRERSRTSVSCSLVLSCSLQLMDSTATFDIVSISEFLPIFKKV